MFNYFEASPGLIVSEDDVRRLILRDQKNNPPALSGLITVLQRGWFIAMVLLVAYVGINAPALWIKSQFVFETEVLDTSKNQQGAAPALPVARPGETPQTTTTPAAQTRTYDNNYLYIDRIKVSAPIRWDVADENNNVLENLKYGVAHLKGNAKPGQNGNTFIVGHSSNFSFAKGDYKQVFALLPELKVGDVITVVYNDKPIQYRVTETKTVKPTDTSVRSNDGGEKLSLMTCVPLGTNLRRLVVIAKPIATSDLSAAGLPASL